MADIAATDVAYTEVAGARRLQGFPPRIYNRVSLAFGNNTLSYKAPRMATAERLQQGNAHERRQRENLPSWWRAAHWHFVGLSFKHHRERPSGRYDDWRPH